MFVEATEEKLVEKTLSYDKRLDIHSIPFEFTVISHT